MKIHDFAFRTRGAYREDVYIVSEDDKYGLIKMPMQDDDLFDISVEELWALGGDFLTPLVWDDIRTNVYYEPNYNNSADYYVYDHITCDYYVLEDGLWGVLNESGQVIQAPLYDEILIVNDYQVIFPIQSMLREDPPHMLDYSVNGRVLVRKGFNWGMIGVYGREILPVIYDSFEIVVSYYAGEHVFIIQKGGLYGVVDGDGKILIPIQYPSLHCNVLNYLTDTTLFRIEGDTGIGYVCLYKAKCLVAPEWDEVKPDSLHTPGDCETRGYFFIVWRDSRCGLIFDEDGMIIPPVWDEIYAQRIDFADPLSYSVRRGDKWGCCDKSGRLICDAVWDEVGIFAKGLACVKKDGKWGVINTEGKLCVPTAWDEIEGFGIDSKYNDILAQTNYGAIHGYVKGQSKGLPDNLGWVKKDGLWGVIDSEGNVIVEPVYEKHEEPKFSRSCGKPPAISAEAASDDEDDDEEMRKIILDIKELLDSMS